MKALAPLTASILCLLPHSVGGQDTDAIAAARRLFRGQWDPSSTIRPSGMLALSQPLLLQQLQDRVYVFDYGDRRLKAIALDGTLEWSLGGNREEIEFGNPTDLQLGPSGTLWIVDARPTRIVIVGLDGRVLDTIPLNRTIQRIAPARNGGFLGIGASTDDLATYFNLAGQPVSHVQLGDWLKNVNPLARETRVAVSSDGGVIIAFHYADHLLILNDHGEGARMSRGIEPVSFPSVLSWTRNGVQMSRVHPEAREATLSLAIRKNRVYVLFGGTSREGSRTVDVYDARDARYQGSFILPQRVVRIAVTDHGLTGIVLDPSTAIVVWKWPAK